MGHFDPIIVMYHVISSPFSSYTEAELQQQVSVVQSLRALLNEERTCK